MKRIILYLILLLANLSFAKSWYYGLDSAGAYEAEIYFDPYYAALNVSTSLGDDPNKTYIIDQESSLYESLFFDAFHLNFVLSEVSLNPLPILGVLSKSQLKSFYKSAEISEGLNVIQTLTTGFPDPGALSLFLGSMSTFRDSLGQEKTGQGYSGFLLNFGNYHIRDNDLIKDYWIESEFKLKGSNIQKNFDLSWSFSLGHKEHFNNDIIDQLSFRIKRERTDRFYRGWSLFKNSELEYAVILNRNKAIKFWKYWDKSAIRYFLLYGKRFPLDDQGDWVLSIGLGVAREVESGYRGDLAKSKDQEWTFIFRPNLLF